MCCECNLLRINFNARVVAKLVLLKGHMQEYEVIASGLNLDQLNIDHQCLLTFSLQKPQDDGAPVIKRPRGRPKGSKNKNPKVWRLSESRPPLSARSCPAPSSHCQSGVLHGPKYWYSICKMHGFVVDIFGLACCFLYNVLFCNTTISNHAWCKQLFAYNNCQIFQPFWFFYPSLSFLGYGQENVTSYLNTTAEHAFCFVVNNAEKTQVPVSLCSQCLQLWCIIT